MVIDSDREEYGPDNLHRLGHVWTDIVRAFIMGVGHIGSVPSRTGRDGQQEDRGECWSGAGERVRGCLL